MRRWPALPCSSAIAGHVRPPGSRRILLPRSILRSSMAATVLSLTFVWRHAGPPWFATTPRSASSRSRAPGPSSCRKLPRLDDVIQRYGERAFLNIELKVKDLESKVLTALGEFPPRKGYVVSSFIPDVVMDLEARSSSARSGSSARPRPNSPAGASCPVDYVIPHQSLVDELLVQDVQRCRPQDFRLDGE